MHEQARQVFPGWPDIGDVQEAGGRLALILRRRRMNQRQQLRFARARNDAIFISFQVSEAQNVVIIGRLASISRTFTPSD